MNIITSLARTVALISVLWTPLASSADNLCLAGKAVDSLSAGTGFYSQNDSACIPKAVKRAAESVFEQRVLSASSQESLGMVDMTTAEGRALKEYFRNLPLSPELDELDKIVLLKQLERCEKHESIEVRKNCVFSIEIRKSSGFIAGDALSLWTNAHAIEGFVAAINQFESKTIEEMKAEKYPIRIFLFDSKGRLALNPFENEITIERLPEKSLVAMVRNSFYAEDSDYVQLKISKAIAPPIRMAKTTPKPGDVVYVAGYPACTGCEPIGVGGDPLDFADRGHGLNSSGVGQWFSTGYILEGRKLWTSYFGLSEQSLGVWQLNNMLFYSADSQQGNSGGPVLNANGEAVTIHAGGLTKSDAKGLVQRVSRGVTFPK